MRRHFVVVPCLLFLAACASTQFPPSVANAPPGANADELWRLLMQGNGEYVAGKLTYPGLVLDREKTAPGQNPPVTLLSCADSRVPPELAFYQTVGDLFVTRAAGNVADQFTIASIEYAILQRYTRVIVVLGHGECGAVKEAIKNVGGTPAVDALLKRIRDGIPNRPCETADDACVNQWVPLNAQASSKYLVGHSEVIHKAVCGPQPTATVVTANYNLVSGRVEVIPWATGDSPCHVVGIGQ